jgi:polyisoprenoid-binding protein YceI
MEASMRSIITLGAALALATGMSRAETSWSLDRSHSNVTFGVTHLVIAEVEGRFTDFNVTLTQPNPDTFVGASVNAEIKTASISTDNADRDKHLVSNDFLNAEKYPVIAFKSKTFEQTGKDTYKIHGDLTIRDVTQPVVLDARFTGSVKDPWGNTKAGFKATTTVDRFAYNVKWDKTIEAGGLVVGKDIEIRLLMELKKN